MKSSWGLAVAGGGAYVGGIEGSVGLVANCYQEADRRYGAGLALSLGSVLGAAFGGSANVTFFWQPGGVADAEGGYVGLGVEAAYAQLAGTIGVQWSVHEGMKGAAAGTPGFYLGWAGPGRTSLGLPCAGELVVDMRDSYFDAGSAVPKGGLLQQTRLGTYPSGDLPAFISQGFERSPCELRPGQAQRQDCS